MRGTKTAAAVSLVALWCGAPGFGRAQTRDLTVAMIGKSMANPVFVAAHRGAQETAKTLGAKLGLTINVRILTPDREDAALQSERLADAVRQRVDAILIAPTDAALVTPAIDKAVDAGVVVMTFDNDAPESKRFAHYGPDDVAAGERVMDELASQLGGKGKVAVLAGNREAANLRARAAGVQRAAERHPGIELIGPIYHEEKPQVAAAEMLRINKETPALKGWALVGGWPLFRSSQTLTLLDDLTRRKLKVVGVDALPEELVYVDRGLAVLMAQPVYDWGAVGVSTIVDKIHRKVAVPERIELKLVRVGKDNLVQWAERLHAWGFQVDPSAYR
jgi:ribose transport system substrate-binding protein